MDLINQKCLSFYTTYKTGLLSSYQGDVCPNFLLLELIIRQISSESTPVSVGHVDFYSHSPLQCLSRDLDRFNFTL